MSASDSEVEKSNRITQAPTVEINPRTAAAIQLFLRNLANMSQIGMQTATIGMAENAASMAAIFAWDAAGIHNELPAAIAAFSSGKANSHM